ncbi:MAG: 50S ribosomal protein L9 [Candidatus Paceibacterota bacterium]
MKVILLKDVPKIGRQYEVKEVSDGYAGNFLLPKKLAEQATREKIKKLETLRETQKTVHKEEQKSLELSLTKLLEEGGITISAPANEQGHLFRGVSVGDILEALDNKDVAIPEELIAQEHPFKEVGEHSVVISVGEDTYTLPIKVEAE